MTTKPAITKTTSNNFVFDPDHLDVEGVDIEGRSTAWIEIKGYPVDIKIEVDAASGKLYVAVWSLHALGGDQPLAELTCSTS